MTDDELREAAREIVAATLGYPPATSIYYDVLERGVSILRALVERETERHVEDLKLMRQAVIGDGSRNVVDGARLLHVDTVLGYIDSAIRARSK